MDPPQSRNDIADLPPCHIVARHSRSQVRFPCDLVALRRHPEILAALSPHDGLAFFLRHGFRGALILGSVVLVVSGGEALYADMGHFGVRPIRLAWTGFVLPSLVLGYLGQGALLLADPKAIQNPFFAMVPAGLPTYLLVLLSSAATVIASQALISGLSH